MVLSENWNVWKGPIRRSTIETVDRSLRSRRLGEHKATELNGARRLHQLLPEGKADGRRGLCGVGGGRHPLLDRATSRSTGIELARRDRCSDHSLSSHGARLL